MKIQSYLLGKSIVSNDAEAFSLFKKSQFGEEFERKIQYTLTEALYLVEKGKLDVIQGKKILSSKELNKKLQSIDKRIHLKYCVFKNLRDKGYIVKTALKFGADFRVYEKGKKPGNAHAKWVVFVDHEAEKLNWNEFAAKNRVAHSTKKKLLLAIVDEENDVSYYEVGWVKP